MLRITKDPALVEALKNQIDAADITPAERAMLDYVRKLTLHPAAVLESDVQSLRNAGFSDGAIAAINAAASYMNFVNRVAQGLGVELEEDMARFAR